jgi:hypothetical protein
MIEEGASRSMERDVRATEDVKVSGNGELRIVEDWLAQDEGMAEGSQSRGEGMGVVMKVSRDEEMVGHLMRQVEWKIVEGLELQGEILAEMKVCLDEEMAVEDLRS